MMAKRYKINMENLIFSSVVFIVCAAACLAIAYPFYYLIIYSLSDPTKIKPGFMLLPRGFNIVAYADIYADRKVPNAFMISVLRSIAGTVCMLVVTSMAAYTMSKRILLGHKYISRYIVFTMYISAGMIPYYQLIYSLKLAHTFWVYVLPGLMSVFSFILIRTYIESIPASLEESAMIDGAGYFKSFTNIVLPMCQPIIATVALFSIVSQWNAYTDTLFYNAADNKLHTLSYVLMQYMKANTVQLETAQRNAAMREVKPNSQMIKMAITTITMLPIMLVYPALQKYFVKGIMVGAIKG